MVAVLQVVGTDGYNNDGNTYFTCRAFVVLSSAPTATKASTSAMSLASLGEYSTVAVTAHWDRLLP